MPIHPVAMLIWATSSFFTPPPTGYALAWGFSCSRWSWRKIEKSQDLPSQILVMRFSDSVDCGFRTSTEITKSYGFQPCCFFGRHHTYVTWIYLYIYICFFLIYACSILLCFQTFFWYQFSWGSKFSSIRNKHRWTAWNFLIEPDGDLPGAEMKKNLTDLTLGAF